MTPLVVSFYTVDTPYEKEAEGLKRSCEKLGLRTCIEGVQLSDDWHTNTLYKPTFLKEQLEKHNEPLLWVDCDGRFRQVPVLNTDCDLAVYTNPDAPQGDWRRMRSSCFLLCPTSGGKHFLNCWIERAADPVIVNGDQEAMVYVLDKEEIIVHDLPLGYVYISDLDLQPEEIVVQHFQASRLYRNLYLLQCQVNCDSEHVHLLKELRRKAPHWKI